MSESEVQRKVRVLFVDDNDLLLEAMVAVLSDMDVTPCRSAKQALAVLQTGLTYDVIVSDMRMPDIPGPEFYARVLEQWPELTARFVFITGNCEGAAKLIADIANRHLSSMPPLVLLKPVMGDEIVEAIMTAIARAQAQRAPSSSGIFNVPRRGDS